MIAEPPDSGHNASSLQLVAGAWDKQFVCIEIKPYHNQLCNTQQGHYIILVDRYSLNTNGDRRLALIVHSYTSRIYKHNPQPQTFISPPPRQYGPMG